MARRRDSGSSFGRRKSVSHPHHLIVFIFLNGAFQANHMDKEPSASTDCCYPDSRVARETLPKRSTSLKRRYEQTSVEGNIAPHYTAERASNVGNDLAAPSPKRQRGEEWPLKNDIKPAIPTKSIDDKVTVQNEQSTATLQQSKALGRPSRFLEASLNDKPSSRPPDIFIGDEELMEQYHQSLEATSEKPDPPPDARIETARPANSFRFGRLSRAFASVFNPSIVWHGFNGMRKEKDGDAQLQRHAAILEHRKMEADKAYGELKRTGGTGTMSPDYLQIDQNMSVSSNSVLGERQPQSFRDSAIDMDEGRKQDHFAQEVTAASGKGKGSLEIKSGQAAADVPTTTSRRVSSLDLHVSSLHRLKKAKSQHQMVSHKHSASTPSQSHVPAGGEYLRPEDAFKLSQRPQMRKDFAKQQKLCKRVSDLETKLELARWELEQSLHDAPPVPDVPISTTRKPFQPGALPSLPSERILALEKLSGHSNKQDFLEKVKGNGESGDHTHTRGKQFADDIFSPSMQLDSELKHSIRTDSLSTVSEKTQLPVAPLANTGLPYGTGVMVAAAQASIHRRNMSRSSASDKTTTGSDRTAPRLPKEQPPKAASKTPCNSPANTTVIVPPESKDPLSMPLLTTRTSYQVLGRPGATSPVRMRTASGKHKRGVSPPPPSLSSAKKPRVATTTCEDENRSEDNNKNKTLSSKTSLPTPPPALENATATTQQKSGASGGLAAEKSGIKANKPLPEIQKEDYQWDDDVF